MPENLNNNRLNIFFTQKEKFQRLLDLGNKELHTKINLSDIISNWEDFSIDNPFVYCINDKLSVGIYNEDKFNASEFVLVHDNFDGQPRIIHPFNYFYHGHTCNAAKNYFRNHVNRYNTNNESQHEKFFDDKESQYYFIVKSIINHFKNK